MLETAAILPTGEEILSGVVLDTDSPEILQQLLRLEPACRVTRFRPLHDSQEEIASQLIRAAREADLVVLVGGSGGGHRFSPTLGRDFTHSALAELLPGGVSREIYGKNGHLWCKLVCGFLEGALVVNLPGPFVEARAAMEAFCGTYAERGADPAALNDAMARAVLDQYPAAARPEA